jgi:hypothetical protein
MVPEPIQAVELSLTQDRLALTMTKASGNIWVLDNVDRLLNMLAGSRIVCRSTKCGLLSLSGSLFYGDVMKTVQMTLDEGLVRAVDQTVKRLKTTRSAFARRALQDALEKVRLSELEEKQREGYRKKPVTRGEFSDWESEQAWVTNETGRGALVQVFKA